MASLRLFLFGVFFGLFTALTASAQIGFPPTQTVYSGAINKTVLKARRVFVTTMLGPKADPAKVRGINQEAVGAVEEMLRAWKRYQLTRTEEDADLILAVRKAPGRGVTFGNRRDAPPVPPTVNNPFPDTADCLALYDARGVGMQAPPLWSACRAGGLDEPQIRLAKEFRAAVERAEN